METFKFTAKVRRTVVDDISLNVRAISEQEALAVAEHALTDTYSGANVPFLYIENRQTEDIEILDIDLEDNGNEDQVA